MMTVRIGILGAADIAPKAVIDPAKTVEGVEVVAVAARDPQRATEFAEEHGITRVLADYQALVEDPDIDVVYIPSPASLHGRWTKQAIGAGKAVLCEKPFTANAMEAEEVAEIAAATDVTVMEAMHSLHHPLWAQTQHVIESGELGTLKSIFTEFSWPITDKSDIRWNPDLAGGALMDMGIYPVTLLSYLFGSLKVISAQAESEDGVDGTLTAQLLSGGGVPIEFKTSMDPAVEPAQILRVEGDRGSLTLTGFVHPYEGGKLSITIGGQTRDLLADERTSYSYMLQVLRNGLVDGKPVITDAAAAVETMRLVDDLYIAAGLEPRKPSA